MPQNHQDLLKVAEAGHAVLQIDLRGCGDSSGDLTDAHWSDWLVDVHLGVQWLRRRHGQDLPLWLWGHRVGALVVAEAARHLDEDCDSSCSGNRTPQASSRWPSSCA